MNRHRTRLLPAVRTRQGRQEGKGHRKRVRPEMRGLSEKNRLLPIDKILLV
jgi:hypothetical protein